MAVAEPLKTDVLIVGAGPTGMVLALFLVKQGVKPRIIDKNHTPGEHSRAIAVQARTLELYRQVGIADAVISAGIRASEIAVRTQGGIITQAKLGEMGEGISPYAYALAYPQDDHERLLALQLEQVGITVERDVELLSCKNQAGGMSATLRTPEGEETLTVRYLCGCDGAGSVVRHQAGIDFPGGTYSQVFYVADVEPKGKAMEGLEISFSRQDFCIVLPVRSSGSIRLIGIVPPECEKKESIVFGDVAASVARNTGLKVAAVNWFSTYHVHHRVAQRFRRGNIFLLGDAAHIHSPAGGQGMNTGIGDAVNLAWKLAAVIQRRAAPAMLDSYAAERMPFAHRLVKTTDRLFQFMASRSKGGIFWRVHILPHVMPVLLRWPVFRRWLFTLLSQTRIRYRQSLLSRGKLGHVCGGDRLPWVPYPGGDNFVPLTALDWQVHVYGEADMTLQATCDRLKFALHIFPWNELAERAELTRDAFYLIRPDGYIALAFSQDRFPEFESYIAAFGIVSRAR